MAKMARVLRMSQSPYDAARMLANLRQEVGFRTYGLVVQALFAQTLKKLGGVVLEINNPGHPDILMILGGLRYNIEVEAASSKTLPRQLERGDLDVLLVNSEDERGYYCVLDSGPPISWLCVDVASLGKRVYGELRISLLMSYSNRDFSSDCTIEFSNLVISQARALNLLTYEQLRREALSSNPR